MKQELINHLSWIANRVAIGEIYEDWSDTVIGKETREGLKTFYASLKNNNDLIDWNNLTVEEAKELGFLLWSDEEDPNDRYSVKDLWLIPLWLYPLIPDGIELTTIGGEKVIKNGDNIDPDARFGCIAYGIIISPENKSQVKSMCDTCRKDGELGNCFFKPTEVKDRKVIKCSGYHEE